MSTTENPITALQEAARLLSSISLDADRLEYESHEAQEALRRQMHDDQMELWNDARMEHPAADLIAAEPF